MGRRFCPGVVAVDPAAGEIVPGPLERRALVQWLRIRPPVLVAVPVGLTAVWVRLVCAWWMVLSRARHMRTPVSVS